LCDAIVSIQRLTIPKLLQVESWLAKMFKHPLERPLTRDIGDDEFSSGWYETDKFRNDIQPLGDIPETKGFAKHTPSEMRLIDLLDELVAVRTF
jgi:hypothetical protein